MLSTPSRGAIQLSHLPSGERRPAARVGLPKNFSRAISGASGKATAGVAAIVTPAQAASSRDLIFMVGPLSIWLGPSLCIISLTHKGYLISPRRSGRGTGAAPRPAQAELPAAPARAPQQQGQEEQPG